MNFESQLKAKIDELPFTKHVDAGMYNDGQIDGFEAGARWAKEKFTKMKILICGLTYGDRPHNVIFQNLLKSGYPAEYILIDRQGIAAALNDGIDAMLDGGFDYVGFLANDIQEPEEWLLSKISLIAAVQDAGAVSTSVEQMHCQLISQHIIGNYLISREAINKVGYFNEEYDPYGPIDLDYCERLHAAGFGTYYVLNEMAHHPHSHAAGTEYGYDKA
jgi:GT2 family glycosyltransferase